MIEIGKTYCRRTVFGFRYACVTKIDLFNGQIHYNLVEIDDEDNIQKESTSYNQVATIDWFTRRYLKINVQ